MYPDEPARLLASRAGYNFWDLQSYRAYIAGAGMHPAPGMKVPDTHISYVAQRLLRAEKLMKQLDEVPEARGEVQEKLAAVMDTFEHFFPHDTGFQHFRPLSDDLRATQIQVASDFHGALDEGTWYFRAWKAKTDTAASSRAASRNQQEGATQVDNMKKFEGCLKGIKNKAGELEKARAELAKKPRRHEGVLCQAVQDSEKIYQQLVGLCQRLSDLPEGGHVVAGSSSDDGERPPF
jgi:hypothetical protein